MKTKSTLGGLFVVGLAVAAYAVLDGPSSSSSPTSAPTSATTDQSSVRVIDNRPDVPGYDRDCGSDGACVFGPAWSDDVDVDGGHNGCDTRNDVLARSLTDATFDPDTGGCVVLTGVLDDPYTGTQIDFSRAENPTEIMIDHRFPLSAAWDHGASDWDAQRRQDFANDPKNLVAVLGSENLSKGDKTPGEWMPENGRCEYATAYLAVASTYELTISRADDRALSSALSSCDSPEP